MHQYSVMLFCKGYPVSTIRRLQQQQRVGVSRGNTTIACVTDPVLLVQICASARVPATRNVVLSFPTNRAHHNSTRDRASICVNPRVDDWVSVQGRFSFPTAAHASCLDPLERLTARIASTTDTVFCVNARVSAKGVRVSTSGTRAYLVLMRLRAREMLASSFLMRWPSSHTTKSAPGSSSQRHICSWASLPAFPSAAFGVLVRVRSISYPTSNTPPCEELEASAYHPLLQGAHRGWRRI